MGHLAPRGLNLLGAVCPLPRRVTIVELALSSIAQAERLLDKLWRVVYTAATNRGQRLDWEW